MARFLRYYNETPLNSEHKKNQLYEMIDSENLMKFWFIPRFARYFNNTPQKKKKWVYLVW